MTTPVRTTATYRTNLNNMKAKTRIIPATAVFRSTASGDRRRADGIRGGGGGGGGAGESSESSW